MRKNRIDSRAKVSFNTSKKYCPRFQIILATTNTHEDLRHYPNFISANMSNKKQEENLVIGFFITSSILTLAIGVSPIFFIAVLLEVVENFYKSITR